jgi:hypothetical protein
MLDLAAALLDRLLDLERVEGRVGIEAHQPLGIVGRRIGRGAALPQHGADAERGKGLDLLGPEIVARHRIDDLAATKRTLPSSLAIASRAARDLPSRAFCGQPCSARKPWRP